MKAKSGFTLVEILIVVVILGILAAIVIPQFTSASTEAKESNLVSNLQAVRSQIELFKIQHNDNLPGSTDLTGGGTFLQCMAGTTDQYGDPLGTDFGPYMQKIPKNPFNALNTVELDGTVGGSSHGWHFTTAAGDTRGLFQADDDGVNALDDDTAHTEY